MSEVLSWASVLRYLSGLLRHKPKLLIDIRRILQQNSSATNAISFDKIKQLYETMRGEPLPIVADKDTVRKCLVAIPGVASTGDGTLFYFYLNR